MLFEVARSIKGWKPGTSSAGGVSHRTAKTQRSGLKGRPMRDCVDPPGLRIRNFKTHASGCDGHENLRATSNSTLASLLPPDGHVGFDGLLSFRKIRACIQHIQSNGV
jgi:hypothetical protein